MQVRLLTLALAATLPCAALAAPVYEQAPIAGSNVGYTWNSQFDGSQTGWQALDHFSLAQAAQIGRVTWRGIYLAPDVAGQCCANGTPNTTSWTVDIYADVAGQPGALAFSQTVAAAQVQTQVAADAGHWGNLVVDVLDFDLQLGNSFAADAGTDYWFSVRANSLGGDSTFSWSMAGPYEPNDMSFQRYYQNGQVSWAGTERGGDRAFALYAVPEPQALGLAGLALLAAWGGRRQRRA